MNSSTHQYVQFINVLSKIYQIVSANREKVTIVSEEIPTPLTVMPFVEVPDFLKSVRSTIRVDTSAELIKENDSQTSTDSSFTSPSSSSIVEGMKTPFKSIIIYRETS